MWFQDTRSARLFRARGFDHVCRLFFGVLIAGMALSATIAPFSASQAGAQEASDWGVPAQESDADSEAYAADPSSTGDMPAADLMAAPVPVEAAPPVYSAGQGIAGFAMQFVGYPYVWAGNTPAGFDCSGFTQYVILNTLGIDIGHGTPGQTGFGAWVDYGAWAPGDLIFFANTFDVGISHAAIYVGDGMIVHAASEETGVIVSSVYSDYYTSHYYGAFRLA